MRFSERPKYRTPRCPDCNQPTVHTQTRYGPREDCPPCGLWAWNGKALVDRETHEARKLAHEVFDALWKDHTAITTRRGAYRCLRQELGLTADECHMAIMDAATAQRVPAAVLTIRERGPRAYGARAGSGQSKRSMRYPHKLDDDVVDVVGCEKCGAPAGMPCIYLGGDEDRTIRPHRARWGAYNAQLD